jgi:quercetin dioxygenase-like cupin family protein
MHGWAPASRWAPIAPTILAFRAKARQKDGMTPPAPSRITGPAEILVPCADLPPTLAFFVEQLGFRVETIFPAEEPRVASLSGHGLRLRFEPVSGDPGTIRLAVDNPGPDRLLVAPNGTRIEMVDVDPPINIPPLQPEFVVTRQAEGPEAGEGRAGMIYRDLIPGRLGERFIASHITIPEGGPVADWVHFHKIGFQLIFCRRGWVRLVYEDQGPPFILSAGDCVLQPPRIRHRVLESSPGLEVVEIGSPALHETLADHDLDLPTPHLRPERDFGGQVFLRHVAVDTPWVPHGDTGFERRDSGMAQATRGAADVRVLRPGTAHELATPAHGAELLFGFLLEGFCVLHRQGAHPLGPADAFVIPAGEAWSLSDCSEDLRLLEVIAPAGA